jgi:hypothetical protein
MRRYTLRFRNPPPGPETADVRDAVERRLLTLPVTFRMGAAQAGEGGEVLVEVESDSRIRDLRALLTRPPGLERLGLASIEWGRQVTASQGGRRPGLDPDDPNRAAVPQADETGVYGYQGLRGKLSAVVPLAFWPVFALAVGCRMIAAVDDAAYFVGWLVLWVLVAGVGVRSPFGLIRSIACDPKGLEIRYWVRPRRRLLWKGIEGLDIRPEEISLRERGRRTAVATRGVADREGLIATIRDRAGLWFVEGGPATQVAYRSSTAD